MQITESMVAAETLVHLAWEAQEIASARLEGVHVSDLILCSRKSWYRHHGAPSAYTADEKLLFMVGSGHHQILQSIAGLPEQMIETEVPVRYVRPGFLIHGTVDLILADPEEDHEIVGEIKTTRYSANKPPEAMSHYLEQIASYCAILGVPRARLYVLHLMGNYGSQRTPIMKCWEIVFDPGELDRWERELCRRYALVLGPALPSVYEAYEWECQYCQFSEKKGGPCPGGGVRLPFFINRTLPVGIPLTVLE